MVINQLAVLHAHVAAVRYNDSVRNSVTDLDAARRSRSLRNAQFRCRIFSSDSCRRFHFRRIVAACCSRVRLDDVHDAACVDVSLRYRVGVGEFCSLARLKCKRLVAQVGVVINQLAVLHAHIAAVRYDDSVRNSVTDLDAARRVRALRDAQLRSCRFSSDSCRCADFRRIVAACCSRVRLDDVHDAACVDVSLRYRVGVGEFCSLARLKCKRLVAQVGVVINQLAVLHAHIAAVRYDDSVRNSVTDLDAARRVRALRDRDAGCRFLGRHRLVIRRGHRLVARILAGGSRSVLDLASVNVCLLHHIRGRRSRRLARRDRRLVKRAKLDAYQDIRQSQAAHRHVAGVLDRDRVGDRFANLHAAGLVCRLRDFNLGIHIAVEVKLQNRAAYCQRVAKSGLTFIKRELNAVVRGLRFIRVSNTDFLADDTNPLAVGHSVVDLIIKILILIIELDCVLRLIQLEVQLQDGSAVSQEVSLEQVIRVIGIKRVLAAFLVGLIRIRNLNLFVVDRSRLACALFGLGSGRGISQVIVLIVEFDLVFGLTLDVGEAGSVRAADRGVKLNVAGLCGLGVTLDRVLSHNIVDRLAILIGNRQFLDNHRGFACGDRRGLGLSVVADGKGSRRGIRRRIPGLVDRQRDVDLLDRQFACGLLELVELCDVRIAALDGNLAERAVGVFADSDAISGRVSDRQDLALAETFDRVVIGIDLLAGAGDRADGVAIDLAAGVIGGLILDRDHQLAGGDFQLAERRFDLVVRGFNAAPLDLVSILARADIGLAAGHLEVNRIAGAELDGAGLSRLSLSPLAADIGSPVAVIKRRTLRLGELGAVIDLLRAGRRDGQRQRLNDQERVTGIDGDRVVRITHHGQCGQLADLLRSGDRVGSRILLGDQRAIGAVKGVPDRIAVSRLEQLTLATRDADVSRTRGIIEVLLVRVGETNIERLTRVVVRAAGRAGVSVPLVSRDDDVDADRLHCEVTGHINNAVILFGIRDCLCALGDLGILRRGGTAAGIRLGTVEFNCRDLVAAALAGDRGITQTGADKRSPVIRLRLVVGDDDQLSLVVDADIKISLIAGNLIDVLGRSLRTGQIGMMIDISVGSLVLHGVGIAFFDIRRIRGFDLDAVHIQIVDRDLGRGIGNVLKDDLVVRQGKLQLLGSLGRLIVESKDFRIFGLGGQIRLVNLNGHFHHVGGGAGHCNSLGRGDLDFRMILQNILHRIGELVGDREIIEGDDVIVVVEGQLQSLGSLVNDITGNGRCLLGDLVVLVEIRIGDDLVGNDRGRRPLFVIMDRVADGLLGPVGIDRDVCRYRLIPVVRRTGLVRRREPSLEGIVFLRRVLRSGSLETVLVGLGCNRAAALGVIGDGAVRERKVAVQHQTGWHLRRATGIGIGLCMLRIREPALPGRALHRGVRDIAGQIAGNVGVKSYILRADLNAVIVVEGQRINCRRIVEVDIKIGVGCAVTKSVILCITPPINVGCRIAILGVAGDLIKVRIIIQIIELAGHALVKTVSLAVTGGRCLGFIVLQPVVQSLCLSSGEIKRVDIKGLSVAVQSPLAVTCARHRVDADDFIVVCSRRAPGIVRILVIECSDPLRGDRCAVLGCNAAAALILSAAPSIGIIHIAVPADCVHVTAVLHDDDGGAVRFHGLRAGFLEGEVRFVQIIRCIAVGLLRRQRDAAARSRRLGVHFAQIGEAVVISVLDHIHDRVLDL